MYVFALHHSWGASNDFFCPFTLTPPCPHFIFLVSVSVFRPVWVSVRILRHLSVLIYISIVVKTQITLQLHQYDIGVIYPYSTVIAVLVLTVEIECLGISIGKNLQSCININIWSVSLPVRKAYQLNATCMAYHTSTIFPSSCDDTFQQSKTKSSNVLQKQKENVIPCLNVWISGILASMYIN